MIASTDTAARARRISSRTDSVSLRARSRPACRLATVTSDIGAMMFAVSRLEKPRPISRAKLSKAGSVGGGLAAAGPDQCEGLAVLVVEEVRVDRSVEARIVELDREVVAAFAGALGPGGADLGFMWCTT